MATSEFYINYVVEQLNGVGDVSFKKMFGEYMVYVNGKPVITVCDNTAFVKKHDCIKDMMECADTGLPYDGAKEHYVLDIDNLELSKQVVLALEKVTPMPKPRKKKTDKT